MKKILPNLLLLAILVSGLAHGQVWTKVSEAAIASQPKLEFKNFPNSFELYKLDIGALKLTLERAPKRQESSSKAGVLVSFPLPGGAIEQFEVYEASIMHPNLAAKYQDIKSYVGRSTSAPGTAIRFSTTIFGLHSINFTDNDGTSYIQPYTKDLKTYLVYNKSALGNPSGFSCEEIANPELDLEHIQAQALSTNSTLSDAGIFRTYRLAITCTIEYAQFHIDAAGLGSGTDEEQIGAVLAAMNVTMTRVNGIYERDAAITMELVESNDAAINITSDNFNNNSATNLLNNVQDFIDGIIGTSNYDIGHIFSTGGGGVAILGSVCLSGQKARGVTGSDAPVGDPFDIDYVAHEMGHQFGANHTFSSNTGSCNGNGSQSTAVEPGSGTTIMAYAGICAPQNVQNNSDAMFHAVSLAQIEAVVSSTGNCSVNTSTNNLAPTIQPIPDYTIPYGTAFLLRGNGTDVDDTNLLYAWEQIDSEPSSQPPTANNSEGPTFRSRNPSTNPVRFFPQFSSIFANNLTPAYEVVSSVNRTYNFALTVRDNDIVNGGQTARQDVTVNVADAGPFTVTSPNTNAAQVAGTNITVTWNVAGTTANGIDTPFVDIWQLTTSSNPFGVLLASKVPNDGSELVSLGAATGGTNRILVIGHNNIFFDISNVNFAISSGGSGFNIGMTGVPGEQNKALCAGESTSFPVSYIAFGGFSGTVNLAASNLPAGITATLSQNTISAQGTFTLNISTSSNITAGVYAIPVTATSGNVTRTAVFYVEVSTASFATSSLSLPANNATGISTSPVLFWAADSGATNYDVQIASDSNFTAIVSTTNTTTASLTAPELASLTDYFWRIRPRNAGCVGVWSQAFKFTTKFCASYTATNTPISISLTSTQTINSPIVVPAAQNITINEVEVYVKINHTWVRDLTARLISPGGSNIRLFQQLCTNVAGNEDVDAVFTSSGATLICQNSNPRISGRNIPFESFAPLNGQNSQGTWTLRISDSVAGDGGQLVTWSLRLCGAAAPLSVDENNIDYGIAIYPNPNNGSFTLSSTRALETASQIKVYDMRGRVLFESDADAANPLNETISLQNAQAGIYLVSITGTNFKEVKRIVVE